MVASQMSVVMPEVLESVGLWRSHDAIVQMPARAMTEDSMMDFCFISW